MGQRHCRAVHLVSTERRLSDSEQWGSTASRTSRIFRTALCILVPPLATLIQHCFRNDCGSPAPRLRRAYRMKRPSSFRGRKTARKTSRLVLHSAMTKGSAGAGREHQGIAKCYVRTSPCTCTLRRNCAGTSALLNVRPKAALGDEK